MSDALKSDILAAIKAAEVYILDASDRAAMADGVAAAIKDLFSFHEKLTRAESRGTLDAKRFKRIQHNNTSGVKGVTFNKSAGKWQAKIGNGMGNAKHLGYFETLDDAIVARAKAEAEMWGLRN